jgi:hypothetical protein
VGIVLADLLVEFFGQGIHEGASALPCSMKLFLQTDEIAFKQVWQSVVNRLYAARPAAVSCRCGRGGGQHLTRRK